MSESPRARVVLIHLAFALTCGSAASASDGATREPWVDSAIKGSPDPPAPYRVERAFPRLSFRNPVAMRRPPVGDRWFVAEQGGRVLSFRDDPDAATAELALDVAKELARDPRVHPAFDSLYGIAFHPRFAENRLVYLCYVLHGKDGPSPIGTRVSRFRVESSDPPRIDPKSEVVLLSWLGGGHNGGDLHFGPDGYLYISTGDGAGPSPPDTLHTGQDLSDLLGSILRIDVDGKGVVDPASAPDSPGYAVPVDNPFVGRAGTRPEIWAYGLRNPWRMSFDRSTGSLWLGDVGWELWEMVHEVRKGGNYGWSVVEGPQSIRPDGDRGPGPILPPRLALPHTEAASITGGYVYRGKRLADLEGAYVFGDWVTRKIWATRFSKDSVESHREIAKTDLRIIAFAEDRDGELFVLHYDEQGSLHRLVPNPAASSSSDFPTRLSRTGLFRSTARQEPANGVYRFSINSELWADGATAERFVAWPGRSTAKLYDRFRPIPGAFFSSQVFMPPGGVLVKTISVDLVPGDPASRRRVETQILHHDGENVQTYSYAWNEEQDDATLVPASGGEVVLQAKNVGRARSDELRWSIPSRTQCATCHNPWAGHALAFTPAQLDRQVPRNGRPVDQLEHLAGLELVEFRDAATDSRIARFDTGRLADPRDPVAGLESRARSYLHANCSHCHQANAGGATTIDLRATLALAQANAVGVSPSQGGFGLDGPAIIVPGTPSRSVLYYRMMKTGRGRMPHLGSRAVDALGTSLVHDWIRSLSDRGAVAFESNVDAPIQDRLATTSGALGLARDLDLGRLPDAAKREVAARSSKVTPEILDLIERFLPAEAKVERLAGRFDPSLVLQRKGDVDEGRRIFFREGANSCSSCHRSGGRGGEVGPDLSAIGAKYDRSRLLTEIVEPSRTIDPAFATLAVATSDGRIEVGFLVRKNDSEVVIRTARDEAIRIPVDRVEEIRVQSSSLMPEDLLRGFTAQEAADLLAFLASSVGTSPPK